MNNVYGICPHCGAQGISRERRLNGNDMCENGHVYPSSSALKPTPAVVETVIYASENGNRTLSVDRHHYGDFGLLDIREKKKDGPRWLHGRVEVMAEEIEQLAIAIMTPAPGQDESIARMAAEVAVIAIKSAAAFKAGNLLAGAQEAKRAADALARLHDAVKRTTEAHGPTGEPGGPERHG